MPNSPPVLVLQDTLIRTWHVPLQLILEASIHHTYIPTLPVQNNMSILKLCES